MAVLRIEHTQALAHLIACIAQLLRQCIVTFACTRQAQDVGCSNSRGVVNILDLFP
jgi:hypothetical protein